MVHPISHRLYACVAIACIASTGCSTLGFSAYPVAHAITDDTRLMLEGASPSLTASRELSKSVPSIRYLHPGDQVLIEATKQEPAHRIPADQAVLADGSIDLGYYGRLIVSGITQEDAETTIQELIEEADGRPTSINVQVIRPVDRFYVIGEVNSPGAYPLEGYETVLDAILRAGGLTNRASACDLLLARPSQPCDCRMPLAVCYRAITQLGDTTTNYQLRPGDRIFVARQSFYEELCGFLQPGRTCDRCCKRQRACSDPMELNMDANPFVSPTRQVIISPRPSPRAEGSPAEGVLPPSIPASSIPASSIPASSIPASSSTSRLLNHPVSILPNPAEPQERAPVPPSNSKDLLDGELNFDDFLQQPPQAP